MTRSMKLTLATVFGTASLLVAPVVFAQAPAAPEAKEDTGDYGYEFDDDPLNAGGFGPNDSTIKVRARAARTTLIRPRTSFVPEMLKSVENI